jgi:hypothetical protein
MKELVTFVLATFLVAGITILWVAVVSWAVELYERWRRDGSQR